MRAVYIAAVIVAVFAPAVYGWGTFLSSFPCPAGSQYPNGLAYRSSRLYISTNSISDPRVWQVRPANGSIYTSHPAPAPGVMGCAAGIAGETISYWVASSTTDYIYQVGYLSGSVVSSFPAPGSHPLGLSFRSQNIMYHTDYGLRKLYLLHPTTGSVSASYDLDFRPSDVAYDGRGYLWIGDGHNYLVWQCTLTGSLISSFSVSAYGFAAGIAYYNKAVWVGINQPLHSVLKFEVDPEYAVAPASLGKVKALFR